MPYGRKQCVLCDCQQSAGKVCKENLSPKEELEHFGWIEPLKNIKGRKPFTLCFLRELSHFAFDPRDEEQGQE
jgi:hypothetical protein